MQILFILFIGISSVSFVLAKKSGPTVLSEKTPFSIVARTQKVSPNLLNDKKNFKAFEKITYTVYRAGVPLAPKSWNGSEVENMPTKRTLKGCLTTEEKLYELKEIKFQKIPVGWTLRLGENCGKPTKYRYRVIGVQALFDSTSEWDFTSLTPIRLRETDKGIEFWTLTSLSNRGNKTEKKNLLIPQVFHLYVNWGRPFHFNKINVPTDIGLWPEMENFEKNFESFFFTGLRDFNTGLMNLALEKYFSNSKASQYRSWGLPSKESDVEELVKTIRDLEEKSNISDLREINF